MGVVLPGERNPAGPRLGVRAASACAGEEIPRISPRNVQAKPQTSAVSLRIPPGFPGFSGRFLLRPGGTAFPPMVPHSGHPLPAPRRGIFTPLSPVSPRPGPPRNGGLPLRPGKNADVCAFPAPGMAKAQTPGGNHFPWLLSTSILPCMTGAEKAFTGTCSVFILCYKP